MNKQSPEHQKADGTVDEVKGRVKQTGGAITGDDKMQAEGKMDELKGKAKKKVAEVRDAVRDKV